jgi:hypothetical protein
MQPDQVLVSSHRARSFHRPGPDGDAPACKAEAAVGEWTVWPRERAEAWREPCQNDACFGDGGDPASHGDTWPVATDGGEDGCLHSEADRTIQDLGSERAEWCRECEDFVRVRL